MAWGTATESAFLALTQNYEFIEDATPDAIVLTLNPRELVNLIFTCDHDGAGTDDIEIQILAGNQISTGNGLDGATSTSDVELDTAADGFSANGDMNGFYLVMTSGGERGEGRLIIASVAADDGVNLSHALSGTPSATETYDLYRFDILQELTVDLADPAEGAPNNTGTIVTGYQYVAAIARMDGATNTPKLKMTYHQDGVSV